MRQKGHGKPFPLLPVGFPKKRRLGTSFFITLRNIMSYRGAAGHGFWSQRCISPAYTDVEGRWRQFNIPDGRREIGEQTGDSRRNRPTNFSMRKYYRFVEGFRRFAKQRMTPEEAIALAKSSIKKRVAARDENFLNFVEKGVFQYSSSPYLKLLEPKKIHFDDLENWGAKDGI